MDESLDDGLGNFLTGQEMAGQTYDEDLSKKKVSREKTLDDEINQIMKKLDQEKLQRDKLVGDLVTNEKLVIDDLLIVEEFEKNQNLEKVQADMLSIQQSSIGNNENLHQKITEFAELPQDYQQNSDNKFTNIIKPVQPIQPQIESSDMNDLQSMYEIIDETQSELPNKPNNQTISQEQNYFSKENKFD